MGPGCRALHRIAGGAAAGDEAALQHFAGRGDAQHCTGLVEGEYGVTGTGAASRRVFAWDEIPGATHYKGRLLAWRCWLLRMAREADARCRPVPGAARCQGRGQ